MSTSQDIQCDLDRRLQCSSYRMTSERARSTRFWQCRTVFLPPVTETRLSHVATTPHCLTMGLKPFAGAIPAGGYPFCRDTLAAAPAIARSRSAATALLPSLRPPVSRAAPAARPRYYRYVLYAHSRTTRRSAPSASALDSTPGPARRKIVRISRTPPQIPPQPAHTACPEHSPSASATAPAAERR